MKSNCKNCFHQKNGVCEHQMLKGDRPLEDMVCEHHLENNDEALFNEAKALITLKDYATALGYLEHLDDNEVVLQLKFQCYTGMERFFKALATACKKMELQMTKFRIKHGMED